MNIKPTQKSIVNWNLQGNFLLQQETCHDLSQISEVNDKMVQWTIGNIHPICPTFTFIKINHKCYFYKIEFKNRNNSLLKIYVEENDILSSLRFIYSPFTKNNKGELKSDLCFEKIYELNRDFDFEYIENNKLYLNLNTLFKHIENKIRKISRNIIINNSTTIAYKCDNIYHLSQDIIDIEKNLNNIHNIPATLPFTRVILSLEFCNILVKNLNEKLNTDTFCTNYFFNL